MLEAKKRDRALSLVKRRFTEITVQQTKQFMTEVRSLQKCHRQISEHVE